MTTILGLFPVITRKWIEIKKIGFEMIVLLNGTNDNYNKQYFSGELHVLIQFTT